MSIHQKGWDFSQLHGHIELRVRKDLVTSIDVYPTQQMEQNEICNVIVNVKKNTKYIQDDNNVK